MKTCTVSSFSGTAKHTMGRLNLTMRVASTKDIGWIQRDLRIDQACCCPDDRQKIAVKNIQNVLVYEDLTLPIGFAVVRPGKTLEFLWVQPLLRRMGYGSKMLEMYEASLQKTDHMFVVLDNVLAWNVTFYQKNGYTIIGETDHGAKMVKMLDFFSLLPDSSTAAMHTTQTMNAPENDSDVEESLVDLVLGT
jgi:GNAT superfamily N-acetyltransferase